MPTIIHPSAIVEPGAVIGEGCHIGPYCQIGRNVVLGAGNVLRSNVVISGHTTVGDHNEIHPFACLGTEPEDKKYRRDSITFTRIGNRNTFREFSTHLPLAGDPAACSMGNPHCTFFVEDLDHVDPSVMGPPIERHPLFPQRTNVHFVQIVNSSRIRLRIWERGGGVPAGSGSCSCAAAVAAIRRGLTEHSVTVVCDGGSVHVGWDGAGGVTLTGRVEKIFAGEFDLTFS